MPYVTWPDRHTSAKHLKSSVVELKQKCVSDPDPAIVVIDLQESSKKLIFNRIFSAYYFLKVHLHYFSKIKSQKESQNSRNQG
jgi:hypothetical protein